MSVLILLHRPMNGSVSEFDGKYVKKYDPTYVHPNGYDGGILEVTADPREAMRFPDLAAALEKWRQPFGMRQDGEPNRPLSGWSVTFETMPDAEASP